MQDDSYQNYWELIEESEYMEEVGDLERSIALLQQASEQAREAGEPLQQSAILNNMALLQERFGLGSVARETLLRSRQILQHAYALKDNQVLNNLGLVERNLGNLKEAKKYYRDALETVDCLPNKDLDCQVAIANSLTNLGLICKDLSQLTEARVYLERALNLLEDSRVESFLLDREAETKFTYIAPVLSALALTSERLNDWEEARNYYLKAREAYELAGDYENEAITLHNLGQIYDNQKNFDGALEYYFQSLTVNLAYTYKLGLAENLSAIAALIGNINQIQSILNLPSPGIGTEFADIISTWLEVVKENLATTNPSVPTEVLERIVDFARSNNIDEMRSLYEYIVKLHQEIGYRVGEVKTLIDLALLSRDAEQLDKADELLTDALLLAEEITAPDLLYDIYLNRGDIRMMAGRTSSAIEDYAAAANAAESIRANLLLEEEALDYFIWPNLAAYERLVRIEAGLERSKQAFFWAEKAKSREFLRRLRLTTMKRSRGISDELIDREMELITQLRQAAGALQNAGEPERLSLLRNYESIEESLGQVWHEVEVLAPEYAALRQGKPASWEELQQCLQL